MYELRERVKWRSRRGLLELDLFFTRFINERLEGLDEAQLENLLDLLTADDHDLWAMVNGSRECEVERWRDMVALLRESGPRIDGAVKEVS
ncbi:FAD assembly factor SdhE [Uliginosibacterium sp. H1]|uniref:FAD assembly factor SdhE n=1 Tax=Uliginosibacterium sp. H1 TaxID=3114757 RepID=UPI002E16DC7E|nr:succinate dehydrogenase assembly factor 2 [Uliginosibacterium sp. H1]